MEVQDWREMKKKKNQREKKDQTNVNSYGLIWVLMQDSKSVLVFCVKFWVIGTKIWNEMCGFRKLGYFKWWMRSDEWQKLSKKWYMIVFKKPNSPYFSQICRLDWATLNMVWKLHEPKKFKQLHEPKTFPPRFWITI